MPAKIVLLSGPVCSGKSTLAHSLADKHGLIYYVKTQDILRQLDPKVENSRSALQALGERLDRNTKGAWVRDALAKRIQENNCPEDAILIVDAVRINEQIECIRDSYGRRVLHIHLTAPLDVLRERYKHRPPDEKKELPSYKKVRENRTESRVGELSQFADIVIDSKQCTKEDVVVRAASHIGLYGREYIRLVDVLVGGQHGSEGKGQIAAYLAPEYDVLVRVGGPNAGHTVYREPKPYTFHHLPSGTLANSEARLILGPGGVINVDTLMREVGDCDVDYQRLSIDPAAMIISQEDIRFEELELKQRIGSTAQGVGAATARKILHRGKDSTQLAKDIPELKPFVRATCELLDDAFRGRRRVFLEGTQGTGLSLHHGTYPYVTSRDTTVAGCLAEAGISPSRVRKVLMVCRTYPIRVESPRGEGATSGPLSQDLTWVEIAQRSRVNLDDILATEKTSTTRRDRRVGEFEWTLLRKSASLNAPTDIALTFVDYLNVNNRNARRFEQLDDGTIRFIEEVERVAGAPVTLISTRFHSRSIIDRRSW